MGNSRTARIAATALLLVASLACGSSGPGAIGEDSPLSPAQQAVRTLIDNSRFDEAESAARELLTEAESRHGPDSIQAAEALDLLVESLWRARKTGGPETREQAERAVSIKEARLGASAVGAAKSLLNLAVVLEFSGDAAAAEPIYHRVIEIREDAFGPDHPEVANALVYLANMHLNLSRFPEARVLYERALAIREAKLDPDDPMIARTLNNLANLLHQTGDYDESRKLYERALDIKTRVYGPDHLEIAWTLNGLAVLLWEIGDYRGALANYERALEIRRQQLGPDHIHVGWTLHNIANVLRDLGEYAEAKSTYERAIEIVEGQLGSEDTDVAAFRNNLAELYYLMGNHAEALRIQREVLTIREKIFGAEDSGVGRTRHKIAAIQTELGAYDEAKREYERALRIYEKALGTEHTDYAVTLSGLARVQLLTGDLPEARSSFRRALAIQGRALGATHPKVAESSIDLARALLAADDFAAARPLLRRAVEIREATLGPQHPLVGSASAELAALEARTGDTATALEDALRAENIGGQHLRLTIQTLAEQRALRYASVRSSGMDVLLSLVAGGLGPVEVRRAWDALCRFRALVLDEMALRHRVLVDRAEPEVERLVDELAASSRRLANLAVRGPGEDEEPRRYLDLLDDARERKEEAEEALARASMAFRQERESRRVGLAEVIQALPSGTALVSYARYDAAGASRKASGPSAESSYVAFVLPPNHRDPIAVPLGTTREIDGLIQRWRREAGEGAREPGGPAAESESQYRREGQPLRERVWDPVARALGPASRVFIVPDGALHLVNFAALPVGGSGYLLEAGPLTHLLSAERDIVVHATRVPRGDRLLVVGAPEFDAPSARQAGGPSRQGGAAAARDAFRGVRSACGEFASMRFGPLPGSAAEVQAIVTLWSRFDGEGVVRLTGAEASEAAFKTEAPGKRVLHMATHGFFLGASCPSALAATRGFGALAVKNEILSPSGENPLLLSGLVLAGANQRSAAGPDEEDGILTAEEIAAMNLTSVEWAVLSACDTGLGEVQAGEGVLGLRRSFEVAGAGSMIMSLWEVEDDATREWMSELYEGRLARGLGTADSVRQASLAALTRRRRSGESTHPFYWASFVAAGDWH